jgi:hypothetical protein
MNDPVYLFGIMVISIKTQMIGNKLKKYNTAAYAQRQAKHIDKGVKLMLPKVAPGYFKVAFNHT